MTMQDPIADLATRIRNAQQRNHPLVSAPHSKEKESICKVLLDEGYIVSYETQQEESSPKKNLTIELKYHQGKAVIESIDRVSRPGLRQYSKAANFKSIRNDLGIAIVSTNKGVMTAKNAKKINVGGEVLLYVE